jgi:serine/threonine-protein phosphatase 2B catalytic subunit
VKNYLFEGGKISKECLLEIMRRVKPVLSAEPNLVRVEGKVVIVGDIHGQFYDLVAMLRKLSSRSGTPNKILFLGDYVDRGNYGPEVTAYLFCLKLKSPNDIFLLRGNHESRDMTEAFNFRDQVLMLYDEQIYEEYMDTFDMLPVSGLVNGRYLAMHGGISHRLTSVAAINQIERRMEPPDDSLLADLLWADPAKGRAAFTTSFDENNERGISVYFGKTPLKLLLKKEGLKAIVRAHQQKQTGYKFHTWDGPNEFPPCITVFSAPNYCASGNDAAVMISEEDKVDVRTFTERQDKPFVLPERADAFSVFQPRL